MHIYELMSRDKEKQRHPFSAPIRTHTTIETLIDQANEVFVQETRKGDANDIFGLLMSFLEEECFAPVSKDQNPRLMQASELTKPMLFSVEKWNLRVKSEMQAGHFYEKNWDKCEKYQKLGLEMFKRGISTGFWRRPSFEELTQVREEIIENQQRKLNDDNYDGFAWDLPLIPFFPLLTPSTPIYSDERYNLLSLNLAPPVRALYVQMLNLTPSPNTPARIEGPFNEEALFTLEHFNLIKVRARTEKSIVFTCPFCEYHNLETKIKRWLPVNPSDNSWDLDTETAPNVIF